MSLIQLQETANIACFSIQHQKKIQAQRYFTQFIKSLSLPFLKEILKNGSQTLLFVTVQYINKFIDFYTLDYLKAIFNTMELELSLWYSSKDHKFFRNTQFNNLNLMNGSNNINFNNKGKQLTKYVENSISLFLSNCMKKFYLQDGLQKRNQIVDWIESVQNQRFKLWLYKIFIQNISQIDTSMGFIKFRTLSYNFQEQVIPRIAKCLIPFLYRVQDIMKINEISSLQQNLNVQQNNINSKSNENLFVSQNQFKFAQLVFDLLHSLVFYNYHLTYTQYQQQSTFDNCLIVFPQQFTSKVVTQEFIGSIGYVIDRLIDYMPNSKFLYKTLECLQKIFLTKLSYINESKKVKFISQSAKILTKTLLKPNITQNILTKIIVCNNKFVMNIELNYFKQKIQLKETFAQWLQTITKTILLLFEKIDFSQQFNFNIQQSVIIQSLDLYQKIAASICAIGYANFDLQVNLSTNAQKQYIKNNVATMCSIILRKILQEQIKPLVHGSTAEIFKSNVCEMKTFCGEFFHPFRALCGLNYSFFFNEVWQRLSYSLDLSSPLSLKYNSFMLLSQIMDKNYLQRNLIMVRSSQEQVFILSKCVNKALQFLFHYMQKKSQIYLQDQQIILMDMSILLFLDKVLSEFLGCFDNSDQIINIKHPIFKNILKISNKQAISVQVSSELLLFCIQSILGYLLIYNKVPQTKQINQFIFDTINRILMKFKWGLRRQVYKKSLIYKRLSHFFNQISNSSQIKINTNQLNVNEDINLFVQFQQIKWRKKLYKMISLLYFDDVIDDYRSNLEKMFLSLNNQHLLTIMLDIEGMAQAIDTSSIFKSFLDMLEKYFTIQKITNQVLNIASYYNGYDPVTKKYPKIKIIKQILRMHKAILSNKGQRLTNLKNLRSIYLIIKSLIGYWYNFLLISQNQEWISILKIILQIFIQLIKCDKINFYLVQKICMKEYIEFLALLFKKLEIYFQSMNEYPKLWDIFIQFINHISKQLLGPIFITNQKYFNSQQKNLQSYITFKHKQIQQGFIRLFLSIFRKLGVYLQQMRSSNNKNENNLDRCSQICRFTLHFVSSKLNQYQNHKKQIIQLTDYFRDIKQQIFMSCKQVFTYLTLQKHYTVFKRNLILVLYESSLIYSQLMEVLIGQLYLPQYLLNQSKQCIQCIKKQDQQSFVDLFKSWLRMIHMSEEQYKKSKSQYQQFYNFLV